jgi:3-dehydroquinate synthase
MNELTIDDIILYYNIDENSSYMIKSYNKDYEIKYNNDVFDTIVKNNYNNGDLIIIDSNIYKLYVNCTLSSDVKYYIFNATENNKTIDSVLSIIDTMKNFTKKNKLIVIGGGITQDVGGFVAGIYKRGAQWVLIPTTLLAMTDSCIGGKVGVNRTSKNILGMFSSPNEVIISNTFITTLDNDMIYSGLGEALKLSLIGGIDTYNYFKENLQTKNYINIIKMSSSIKKVIIEKDEFDLYERKVLNYGHTIGHAIESTTNYEIPHGIAVLIGMYLINKCFKNNLSKEINEVIYGLIDKKFINIIVDTEKVIEHILNDKKNNGDMICFIILKDIGHTTISYFHINDVKNKIILEINSLFIK